MEKCYFLKIPQWPDFEILGGHSHHQDTPKNQRARHGTFFFIRITFSSHVSSFEHVTDVKRPNFQITMFSSLLLDSIHVYRSADGSLPEVRDHLQELVNPARSVLISGDFNICLDKEPKNIITSYLQQQGFQQLVKEATHDEGGRIDHIYFKQTPELEADAELLHHHPYYSDHDALCLTLKARLQQVLFLSYLFDYM